MPRHKSLLALLLIAAVALAGPAIAAKKPKAGSQELSVSGRNNLVLAQAYLDAGKLDPAADRARAALDTDPGSALAHATMALVHVKRKDHAKAQASFTRALQITPNNGAILNSYGAWLCERGQREQADAAFLLALKDPGYRTPAQALVNAGRCALADRQWVRGEGYLRRALTMAPNNRSLLLMLAETQLKLGRPMDARAFVQRADALGPDAVTLSIAARVEDQAGDAVAAARYRHRMKLEFPTFVPTGEGARTP